MSRLPIPRFIQEIKTKLGFDRTMTAPGADVVDAVNKQAGQIVTLQNAKYYYAIREDLQQEGTGTITLTNLTPGKVYPVFIANESKYFVGMLEENAGWKLFGATTFTSSEVSCTAIDIYSCTITVPRFTRYLIMTH